MESPHFKHLIDPRLVASLKEPFDEKRRDVCCIATARTERKIMVRFCGMLLLSAKNPRPPGWWENTMWQTIWRIIQRTNNTFRSNGWTSSDFTERSGKNSSIWQENSARNLSWLCADCGEEFGKETFWLRLWKIWKSWMHQIFILEEWTQKKYWPDKNWGIHIPNSRWYSKIVRKRLRILSTHSEEVNRPRGVRISVEKNKANRESLNQQNLQTTLKPVPVFARSKVTSSIVIAMNLEFNSTCLRKKHSPFHWNTLMLQSLLTLIWTSCKRNVSTTIGMSFRTETCQIPGEDWQSSLYWKKNLQRDTCGPGRDSQSSNDCQTMSCKARSMDENL